MDPWTWKLRAASLEKERYRGKRGHLKAEAKVALDAKGDFDLCVHKGLSRGTALSGSQSDGALVGDWAVGTQSLCLRASGRNLPVA